MNADKISTQEREMWKLFWKEKTKASEPAFGRGGGATRDNCNWPQEFFFRSISRLLDIFHRMQSYGYQHFYLRAERNTFDYDVVFYAV